MTKHKFTNPLDNIKVASPCSADWNQMIGSNRQRHCGDCNLNVYNLSGMSRNDAMNLLLNAEGRVCVRYFRRPDGTVLTKDCPVGWKAFKHRVSKTATAFASLLFGLIGGLGANSFFSATAETYQPTTGVVAVEHNQPIMGDIAPVDYQPEEIMGEVPIDNSSNIEVMGGISEEQFTKGKVSNIDEVKRQILEDQER